MLINQGTDLGYFSEMAKYIFISDNPEEKEAARQEFMRVVLHLIYVYGS